MYFYARLERQGRRLFAQLVIGRRIDGVVRQQRVGSLGSIPLPEPFSSSERVKFWAGVAHRYRAIMAKRPDVVSLADEERIRAVIAKRIPPPSGEAEVRLLLLAAVQRDVAAIDNLDGAVDVFAEVARRLKALAREVRPKAETEAERLK
jgi:hypothetical protein